MLYLIIVTYLYVDLPYGLSPYLRQRYKILSEEEKHFGKRSLQNRPNWKKYH